MSRLALFYLGTPRIERDGQTVDLKLAKAKALLFYLTTTHQIHSREALASLLWPDYPQDRSQTSLRSALLAINTALGREWLEADRKTVRLVANPNVWIDGEQYQEYLAECRTHGHPETEVCANCLPRLAEAANLYHGDFLSGLVVRDSAPFEEWHAAQTEQMRRLQSSVLARLARGHGDQNNFEEGIAYARRWVGHDRWDEAAHHLLIELYWRSGQRSEALRQYQACIDLLDKELGVPPSEELTSLYRQIQAGENRRPAAAAPSVTPVVPVVAPVAPPPPPVAPPPVTPPITLPADTVQSHLPPFVGREAERAQIEQLLREDPNCRLVMLVGPGGIGKTRLARQIADEIGSQFPNGMAFVSLAPVTSMEFLLPTMAKALKFATADGEDLSAQLLNYLRDKKMLLVMDNLEHLLESAELLDKILEAAPSVKILATSQERLNLRGEWLFNLGGLDFPSENAEGLEVESYSAAQLFLQTARRVNPTFNLSPADYKHVARICNLVDGMPLGIELAATWVRLLTCEEIARELQRGLSILETSLRNVPERHRSLRAVFDHSWRLLSPEEQRIFRRMAVFRGGFPSEAAVEVAGASLGALLSLADRGLLRRRPGGRYNRHPLLWQYTADKLNADLLEVEEVRDRHCAYYTTFLQQQGLRLKGPAYKEAMEAIETDFDNVREAWRWAVLRAKLLSLDDALEGLFWFYDAHGWFQEGEEAFNEASRQIVPEAGAPLGLCGRLQVRHGVFLWRVGQNQAARDAMTQGLEWLEQTDAKNEQAFALAQRSRVMMVLGEFTLARADLQNSLMLYQATNTDQSGLAYAFKDAGAVLARAGDFAQSMNLLLMGLNIFKGLGDPRGMVFTLNNLGVTSHYQGKYTEARAYWEESLLIYQQLGDTRGTANVLNNLGMVAIDTKRYTEAIPLLEKSLALLQSIGHRVGTVNTLDSLGQATLGTGDYAQAHRYIHDALRITLETHSLTDILEELVTDARIFWQEGKTQRALDLLAMVWHHPKGSVKIKSHVEQLKKEILESAPDLHDPAYPPGWEPDLEAEVTELLAEGM